MLRKQPWLAVADELNGELLQCEQEGKDVSGYCERVKIIKEEMDPADPVREIKAGELYDELYNLPLKKDYPYIEPSDLEGIKSARPESGKNMRLDISGLNDEKLYDKAYGAWLGRCAGCLLGKPIEGWMSERITGLLKETDNYPFKYYISSDIPEDLRKKYDMQDWAAWINKVSHAPEDDDTNYTIMGLKILETYGPDFTPDDVAEAWLNNLPIFHVCTAERIAYKNLVNLVYPPLSASLRNPWREMIGAQIRADFFGYVTPGNPELGAEYAWRDACISHVKNGIYGEMFVAAMLSAAAVMDDIEKIIECGLSQIPEKSRLYAAIKDVLGWKKEGLNWEQAIDRLRVKYNEKEGNNWLHTIPNAVIVCIGLIFGELDFEKSISITVLCAHDTDCNGATVGSIAGMVLGAKALPEKWLKPLNNQLKSGVDGFGLVKISDVAKMTVDMIKKVQEKDQGI